MQRVLIAGGAGFIGSHLVERLLDQDYSVSCLDNLLTGNKNNIQDFLSNPQFSFFQTDIVAPISQEIASIKWDLIFHLASPASPNKNSPNSYINHPLKTLLVNSQGTYHLLELAKQTHAKFLYASTSEIYGDPLISPQKEEYFGNVNPNGVRSVYDEAKRFGEAMTMCYIRNFGVDGRIIRIFNTFGPKMQPDDGRVVSNFIYQALQKQPITIYGDGNQTRSFCYVSDMVDGIVKAMTLKDTRGEVINLGNPDERSISELATIIKKMTESDSEIIYQDLPEDDPKVRRPDIGKANRMLQWNPETSLQEGLKKTIEYFKMIL